MNIVDLHPEDLLDEDLRGELTTPDRARLAAHLRRCRTCRFERAVRDDFASELAVDDRVPVSELSLFVEKATMVRDRASH